MRQGSRREYLWDVASAGNFGTLGHRRVKLGSSVSIGVVTFGEARFEIVSSWGDITPFVFYELRFLHQANG